MAINHGNKIKSAMVKNKSWYKIKLAMVKNRRLFRVHDKMNSVRPEMHSLPNHEII